MNNNLSWNTEQKIDVEPDFGLKPLVIGLSSEFASDLNIQEASNYIFRECPIVKEKNRTVRIPIGRNATKHFMMRIHCKNMHKIHKRSFSKFRNGSNNICFNSLKDCKYAKIDVRI